MTCEREPVHWNVVHARVKCFWGQIRIHAHHGRNRDRIFGNICMRCAHCIEEFFVKVRAFVCTDRHTRVRIVLDSMVKWRSSKRCCRHRCLCVYTFMYVHVYMYIYIYTCIHTYTYTYCVHIYAHIYTCMYVPLYNR